MSIENKQVYKKMMHAPVLMIHALVENEECQKAFGEIMALKLKSVSFSNCETTVKTNSQFYQPE